MGKKLKVVVVGMGFMGRVHAQIWLSHELVDLVAVVDFRPEDALRADLNKAGLPDSIPLVASLEKAIDCFNPDVIDLCTPTYLHAEQAQVALEAGCHVLCEKPLALDIASADTVLKTAKRMDRTVMVGHCIQFWPEYEVLRDTIENASLGKLLFLDMERTAGRPGYAVGNWTNDPARCVGGALDMHIHDADWIRSVFGIPQAVASSGVKLSTGWDYLTTHYHYLDGVSISARGGWCLPARAPFRMGYQAVFEGGVLEWDSAGEAGVAQTSDAGIETLLDEKSKDPLIAYRHQIAYFIDCLTKGIPVTRSSGYQARESVRLVLAEIESAASGQVVCL